MTKISIITVNLNNKDGLRKTIESVLNQTYKDIEYIVIDGGSTDGSIEIIKQYENQINYWISEPDKGIYNAMNKGILKATGEYLQFLNSGDCLVEETIITKVFEIPRIADIIYGHLNIVFDKDCKVHKSLNEDRLSLAYFFKDTLAHPSAFISRKLFNVGLYDENYKIAADKKFFIEKIIFQNCSIQQIDMIIVNFNTNGISYSPEYQSISKEENDKIFAQLLLPRISKDYENLNYYENLYFFQILKKLHFFYRFIKRDFIRKFMN
jgi:glycosyltransferase involved in cell wall biosynthesis